jgi:hypothetical protein
MALPGITTGRNIVVASVQSSTEVTPVFQESYNPPTTRPNGGDLVSGDTWWSTNDNNLYIWSGTTWNLIGGPGHYADLVSRIESLESMIDSGDANSYS